MNDTASSSRNVPPLAGEEPEDANFDGEWEVVQDALEDYDRRHNWFVSLRSRKEHMQLA